MKGKRKGFSITIIVSDKVVLKKIKKEIMRIRQVFIKFGNINKFF